MKKQLYKFCKRYIRWVDGYSYNTEKNGERWVTERLAQLECRTIFDAGANVGKWTSIALTSIPSATVHAFELSESTYRNLLENVGDNSRCKLNNIGLSNTNATLQYKDYGENSGKNTLLTEADFHDNRIPPTLLSGQVVRGEDYCREQGITSIDFLKIDVEGAEHLVIEGFSSMLEKQSIRMIQFEYGYTHGDVKFLMRDFYALFNRHGYKVGLLRQGGVKFQEWSYSLNDFTSGPNYIAIRSDDEELTALISAVS